MVKPDSGRGYRRVVASPQPLAVIEIEAMRAWSTPARRDRRGRRRDPGAGRGLGRGVDAVIDKDAPPPLAHARHSAQALLVTAVDRVMLDYGTPTQSELDLDADQAARYLAEGQFPPGSMGPKIESALRFLATGASSR